MSISFVPGYTLRIKGYSFHYCLDSLYVGRGHSGVNSGKSPAGPEKRESRERPTQTWGNSAQTRRQKPWLRIEEQ